MSLNRGQEVGEFPFGSRAIVFEQFIGDRERILRQIGLGISQILVEIGHHIHRPVHSPPMTGERADIRINARLLRRGEVDLLRAAGHQQLAGEENLRRIGNIMPLKRSGLSAGGVGQVAQLFERAGPSDNQIVRHDVGVFEHDLGRLAGLHDDPLLVVKHLIGQRRRGESRARPVRPAPCEPISRHRAA